MEFDGTIVIFICYVTMRTPSNPLFRTSDEVFFIIYIIYQKSYTAIICDAKVYNIP